MKKIKISDIVVAAGGNLISNINMNVGEEYISSVCADSRKASKDCLFVALEGEKTDGHKYIPDVIALGTKAIIISKELDKYEAGVAYILVKSSIDALSCLAKWYIGKFNINTVAITGSVGKTTTKDMIASVLGKKYKVLKTEGNQNSTIGLPLTVFRLDESIDFGVFEMGMDGFGQIDALSKIVLPDVAVITNIGISHIEHLNSRENILTAKSEIFNHLKQGGIAVLNIDDDMLIKVKPDSDNYTIVWYGKDEKADYIARDISVDVKNGQVKFNVKGEDIEENILIDGMAEHLIYPALTAIIIGKKYGLSMEEIKEGLKDVDKTKMRMEIKEVNGGIVIDDTYNASPASMKALIDVVEKYKEANRVVILGDMFELGAFSQGEHTSIGEYLLNKDIETVIFIGENMKSAYDAYINSSVKREVYYFKDKEKLNEIVSVLMNKKPFVVGVKASRGMKFENIVSAIVEKLN